jgi:thioredoxin-related protein
MMRGIAIILVLSGLLLIYLGAQNPEDKVNWLSYSEALELAKNEGKPVLVYLHSETCAYCRAMERNVFSDENVADALEKNFIPAKVDVLKDRVLTKKLLSELEIKDFVTPSFVIIDPKGRVVDFKSGYMGKTEFLKFVGSEK